MQMRRRAYELPQGGELGRGAFAIVRRCVAKTGAKEERAAKIIDLRPIRMKESVKMERVKREATILKKVRVNVVPRNKWMSVCPLLSNPPCRVGNRHTHRCRIRTSSRSTRYVQRCLYVDARPTSCGI